MKFNTSPVFFLVLLYVAIPYIGIANAVIIMLIFLGGSLVLRMTKEVTITYLMSCLAVLQWLLGPVAYYSEYNPGMTFEITKMQVTSEEYFAFALPATFAFCIGLLMFKVPNSALKAQIVKFKNNLPSIVKTAKTVIVVAFLFDLFKYVAPIQLKQYVFFIGYLKYFGLSILAMDWFYSKSRSSAIYFLGATLLLVLTMMRELMFGEFVFACALILIILLPIFQTPLRIRLISLSSIFMLVVAIQLIKPVARVYMWDNKDSTLGGLVKVVQTQNLLSLESFRSKRFVGYSIARFNQGSVISWTMKRVPKQIPFENGKTVVSSTLGSFIPRLLWPNKPLMGTIMYQKYTGLDLEGASYGISQLGEAYVNFGTKRSIWFMLILGLIFNAIQNKIVLRSSVRFGFYFILPIIFLHGIKVETDITRSLGFIIRYIIFLELINVMIRNVFQKKIY